MRLGGGEIIVILLILLLLFGGKKLPELASGMGKALKNFRKAVKEPEDETGSTAGEAGNGPVEPNE